MKRRIILFMLVACTLISAGCVGGTAKRGVSLEAELSAVVGQMATQIKNRNASAVADAYTYPVVRIDEFGNTTTVESRDTMIGQLQIAFVLIEAIHTVTSSVTNATQTGNVATATVTTVMDFTVFGYRSTATTVYEMTFHRIGGQWKIKQEKVISSTSDVLAM